ncbi:hypothetical protein LTR36_006600 [Oleoguttula mirabilis]|uniref:Ribonuclease H2 subunit B n=1 Tax=Oleoguttula mirabilis TaxID=1507867 RepID=A0AAV9JBH3_9PEZI|nr:hypothetical protein LTR36_006600 [Oleoguttula mirabilis]
MKTRSRKPAASKAKPDETTKPTLQTLEPSVEQPPQLFVLPKNASPNARIITLPNPASSTPSRYFADPKHGFYEFTRIAAPKKACRSWLLAPDGLDEDDTPRQTTQDDSIQQDDEAYVLQTPDLFIATPIDPLFIVLPALWPADDGMGRPDWGTLHDRLFFEPHADRFEHLQTVLKSSGGRALETMIEKRMRAVCNVIDTGPEEDASFTLNVIMLAGQLLNKALKMVKAGLPASMEEHFVKKALEMPELSMRREESSVSMVSEDATAGAESPGSVSAATSQNTDTSATSIATVSTTATTLSVASVNASSSIPPAADISHLLRLRTALTFLLTTYTPPALRAHLQTIFADPAKSPLVDFTPLNKHLAHIAALRSEAQALRSISDNISRKRGVLDDDEAVEKANVKKQKKEDEEAKKKGMSHGVKRLMKADTSGMKKMSSFFGKAAAGKKG